MQRAQSRDFVASAAPQHFPTVLFQVGQQRQALLTSIHEGLSHPGLVSGIRIRSAARQSQARMVGGRKISVGETSFSQQSREAIRCWNQPRSVEASGMRSASSRMGAACSIGAPAQ